MPDLVAAATTAESLNVFVAAIEACELSDTLRGTGPLTVFAPNDAAFVKLPAGTVQQLFQDLPQLTLILTYHIAPGLAMAADLMATATAVTLRGQTVTFANAD